MRHSARIRYLLLFALLTAGTASAAQEVDVGTTFSPVQCEYFKLDWRETYREVLAMGFDIIRLGAYWNRTEKTEGEYDFSELDWQIAKAEAAGVPVLLTVGMKAPRWPEYFIPFWLREKVDIRFGSAVSDRRLVQEGVKKFITAVVDRYKDRKIITAWQVENEPLSRAGPDEWWIRKSFLKEEIALVKKLDADRRRPVVINAMTYPNAFLRVLARLAHKEAPVAATIDIAQIPALDVYPAIGQKMLGQDVCFWTHPKSRVKYLRKFAERAKAQGKPLWVTELQAEPWEPGQLVHTSEEAPMTCGAETFFDTFEEMRSLGIRKVFLWGAEYWYYRKKTFDDGSWIKTFRRIVDQAK